MKPQTRLHPLRQLWNYAADFHGTVGLATLFSILNKLFDLAPPILIGTAVDVMVERESSLLARMGVDSLDKQLVVLAVSTGAIWGLESLFEYLYRVRWRNLAQAIQHRLRMDAYTHTQQLELAYFEEQSTGRLMAILNDDVNQLERFLDEGANDILQVLTTTVVIGAIFVAIAPQIGWMTILPMPFIAAGSIYFQKHLGPLYARVREQVSTLNSRLANNLSGIATIKSYTAERPERARVEEESQTYGQRNRDAIRVSSAFVPVIRMIIVTGFIAILFFGGRMTLEGRLAVGAYSVMIFMTQRLLWPLTRLGSTLDLYERAVASTDRIFELLRVPPESDTGTKRLERDRAAHAIQFRNVCFRYGALEQEFAIEDLSLDILAGQTAAVVGATGSGKSTLAKLLLRFYDVGGGSITIAGTDIRQLERTNLRQAIGFVSQDVYLFHGTVRENILYGCPEASEEALHAAARAAEAHTFINQLPQGYETVVGERGQKLSGGQRQRISIARAVLKDPPILVLDEATSAVDNETEAAIQRSLRRIAIGRTTLVIAHRLSTIRNADVIYVLSEGQLVEQGTHAELVAADGAYAALWRVQTGATQNEELPCD